MCKGAVILVQQEVVLDTLLTALIPRGTYAPGRKGLSGKIDRITAQVILPRNFIKKNWTREGVAIIPS